VKSVAVNRFRAAAVTAVPTDDNRVAAIDTAAHKALRGIDFAAQYASRKDARDGNAA
jgi:hypothetical protein